MVDDEGFGRALHQVAFGGMGRNDVTDGIRHAALHRQRHAGDGVTKNLAARTLHRLAVPRLVFQQLANVGQP